MDYKPSYSDSLRADIQPSYRDSLMHHGIKGMKWGVRRFQNPDGSYTKAGKDRRSGSDNSSRKELLRKMANDENDYADDFRKTSVGKKLQKRYNDAYDNYFNTDSYGRKEARTFEKAERNLLYNEGTYVARKMIDKYGEDTFKNNQGSSTYTMKYKSSGKAFIDEYANEYVKIHGVV